MVKRKKREKASKPIRMANPPPVTLDVDRAYRYLGQYVRQYRRAYERFTTKPPTGPGYPDWPISPYLDGTFDCFLTRDGAVIAVLNSTHPLECFELVGLYQKPTPMPQDGAILKMTKTHASAEINSGRLPRPVAWVRGPVDGKGDVRVLQFQCDLRELVQRLTFGSISFAPCADTAFWLPMMFRNLIFQGPLSDHQTHCAYLEILQHIDYAAWDQRSTVVRAHADVQRDFVSLLSLRQAGPGGTLSFPSAPPVGEALNELLLRLDEAIVGFDRLLAESPDEVEDVFHQYLKANPILLDAYAEPRSKPRFVYPEPQSHTAKLYVEPDFVLVYPDRHYKLVELERPRTPVARQSGEGRSSTSHAAFQVAEWRHFIANYPQVVRDEFPGLVADNVTTMLVIGRARESRGIGASRFDEGMEVIRRQYGVNELITFDGLLDRAKRIQGALVALAYAVPIP